MSDAPQQSLPLQKLQGAAAFARSTLRTNSRDPSDWYDDVQALAGLLERIAADLEPASLPPQQQEALDALRGLDSDTRVRFYEHDFYVLSNFSAFNLHWEGRTFPTSEHAYHWSKFDHDEEGVLADLPALRYSILTAPSAHEAFKLAEANKAHRRIDWDDIKGDVMLRILRAKAHQHEYVRRKLLATGDRELVEDSWRDDYWGWGPNRDGKNMLGRLWMRVRDELRAAIAKGEHHE